MLHAQTCLCVQKLLQQHQNNNLRLSQLLMMQFVFPMQEMTNWLCVKDYFLYLFSKRIVCKSEPEVHFYRKLRYARED